MAEREHPVSTVPSTLTVQQLDAIARLAEGQSLTDVAHALGLRRTTIHHWRRTNSDFALALSDAQQDLADTCQHAAQGRATQAWQALDRLLSDDRTPPSIRLKAALYVLTTATSQPGSDSAPPPRPRSRPRPATFDPIGAELDALLLPASAPAAAIQQNSSLLSKFAVAEPTHQVQTVRYDQPKPGRNDKCPCGSNRKFKQCCLNRPVASRQQAA